MPVDALGEGVDEALLSALAEDLQQLLAQAGWPEALVELAVVDDDEIARLNGQWRGRSEPTDILSFPLLTFQRPGVVEAPFCGEEVMLGSLVLSEPTARRQAATVGQGFRAEAQVLLAHGVAHLLGYDHQDPDGSAEMARVEDGLLRGLGTSAEGLIRRVVGAAGGD